MASRDEIIRFVFEVTGDKDLASAVAAMSDAGKAGGQAEDELRGLVEQLVELRKQSDAIREFTRSKAELTEIARSFESAKVGLAALNAEFVKGDDSSRAIASAYKRAEKAVADLETRQKAVQVAFAKAQGELQKSGVDTEHLATANESLRKSAGAVVTQIEAQAKAAKAGASGMRDAGKATGDLGDKAKHTTGILGELRDTLGKIVSVAAGVSLALKGIKFGTEAFASAADLEKSLARVSALAGDAQRSLASYETGIRAAAESAGVSSNAAAEAMAGLVQQGRTADEAFAALVPTILLAKDAQLEFGQAASMVDALLSQFGGSAQDAAHYVDLLVAASKGSKEGLSGMADGLGKLAPLARDVNMTFDETATLLGFLTKNGLSARDATRGLSAMFRDLADPASMLSQQLFALGDSSGKFDQAIRTLTASGAKGRESLLKLDDASRKVVLFLQQQGVGSLDAFRGALANVEGAAGSLDRAIGDNLQSAFSGFTRAIDEVAAQLAQPVLEPLKNEFRALAESILAFSKSPAFDDLKREIGEFAANATEAVDQFLRGIDWDQFITGAKTAIHDAGTAVGEFKDDITAVTSALNELGVIVGVVYRSITVVFDLAKTAISGAVASKFEELAALSAGLDKLRGSTSELTIALEAIQFSAQEAASKGMASLRENSDKLVDNLGALAGVADSAATGIDQAGARVDRAASSIGAAGDRIARTGDDINAITGSVSNAAGALGILPELFNRDAQAAQRAADAHSDHAQQVIAARNAVTAAESALVALVQSGNASADAFRSAQAEYAAASANLDSLTGATQAAAAAQGGLKQAFATLKVSAQSDLADTAAAAEMALDTIVAAYRAGNATIEDVRRAFAAYAQAARAAAVDSDKSVQSQAESHIALKESMLGVTDAYSRVGDAGASAATRINAAVSTAKHSVDDLTTSAKSSAIEFSGALGPAMSAMAGYIGEFGAHSKQAADDYTKLVQTIFESGYYASQASLAELTGITRFGDAVQKAAMLIREQLGQQVEQMKGVARGYAEMTDAQLEAMARQRGGLDAVSRDLSKLADDARNGKSQFAQLGATDLGPLISGLESASQKAQQLAERARQTKQELSDMADEFRVQIANMNGDQVAAENLQFQQQMERLRLKAELAGALNSQEYREAVNLATKLHNLKLKQLADEAAARKRTDDSSSSSGPSSSKNTTMDVPPRTGAITERTESTLKIALNGTGMGFIDPSNAAQLASLTQVLTPAIIAEIKRAAQAAGGLRG